MFYVYQLLMQMVPFYEYSFDQRTVFFLITTFYSEFTTLYIS